ncbi:MAG: response regulator transcription factor, partial [Chloroflexi bacterium]|nr:response regulator transcription factor [Chloroflexota bacterium]
MIKLLIADDHHLFRDGLSRIINEIPEFDLRAVAQNGKEALDFALQHQPDVVLMDLHMPEMNGIEATEQILAQNPDIHILILTISEEDVDLFTALRAGAGGYLLKNTSSQNLISAIKDIVA